MHISPQQASKNRNYFILKAKELMKNRVQSTDATLNQCYMVMVCAKQHPDVLAELLEYGLNPNLCGFAGFVINSAITGKCLENVRLLVKYGADVNKASSNVFERTPLQAAINMYNVIDEVSIEIVKVLLAAGANPNVQDNYGNTVLFTAIKNGEEFRSDLISLLLKYNADPFVLNKEGRDAMMVAREMCFYDDVERMDDYLCLILEEGSVVIRQT